MPFSELIQVIPDPIIVFFMAMLPITELQGAIIFGVTVLDMNPWVAFVAGTTGCITMASFLLVFLESIALVLRKHFKIFDRFFDWLFKRTQLKYSKGISELGHLALFTYIAIPTPGSGGWTGALIAFVFGIPRKKAALIMTAGLIVTGLLVMFGTEGVLLLVKAKS
ncbi:MAG: small multi-drug export protein [Candidatus Gracilibacteria bacterium]|jgi:uncharacterized membrane protein